MLHKVLHAEKLSKRDETKGEKADFLILKILNDCC